MRCACCLKINFCPKTTWQTAISLQSKIDEEIIRWLLQVLKLRWRFNLSFVLSCIRGKINQDQKCAIWGFVNNKKKKWYIMSRLCFRVICFHFVFPFGNISRVFCFLWTEKWSEIDNNNSKRKQKKPKMRFMYSTFSARWCALNARIYFLMATHKIWSHRMSVVNENRCIFPIYVPLSACKAFLVRW